MTLLITNFNFPITRLCLWNEGMDNSSIRIRYADVEVGNSAYVFTFLNSS